MSRTRKVSPVRDAVLVHSTDRQWPQRLTDLEVAKGVAMHIYNFCLSFKYGSDARFYFRVEARNKPAARTMVLQAIRNLIGPPEDAVQMEGFDPKRSKLDIPIFYVCNAFSYQPPKDDYTGSVPTRLFDEWGNEVQIAPIEGLGRHSHFSYVNTPMGLCPGVYWETTWQEEQWPEMMGIPKTVKREKHLTQFRITPEGKRTDILHIKVPQDCSQNQLRKACRGHRILGAAFASFRDDDALGAEVKYLSAVWTLSVPGRRYAAAQAA